MAVAASNAAISWNYEFPTEALAMERRDFLVTAAAATAATAWVARQAEAAEPIPVGNHANDRVRGEMRYRQLGSTGVEVSCIGVGGFHIGSVKEEQESIRIVRTAVDRGITFMDNCWDYHDGESERRMGKALRDGYRDKVFLMSKIDGRTKESCAQQIDESLERLQTDHVDLMQFHEMIRMEDADRVFIQGGALEAMQEAKQAGKVRFIGFTGHKDPLVHLRTLEIAAKHGFRFDTVQMPLNVLDAHFRSFARAVVPELVKQKIGVLGMKPFASGAVLLTKSIEPIDCLHYALNLPTSVVITGIDSMNILDQAFEAVRSFRPMNSAQVDALLAKTAAPAADGAYERFKTDTQFDSTAKNPKWLG
jgi:predicted aldo/keto reductase-like oxidoreductase